MNIPSNNNRPFRALVLSVVKHDYIALSFAEHPAFELVAVADDADRPDWTHERNQKFADQFEIPYVTNLEQAIRDHKPDLTIISSEAERHCDLAMRAAAAGLHIVVDKPLSPDVAECDQLVAAVESTGVKSLLWNRNLLPAVVHARDVVRDGTIGEITSIHCDFYFSKDAGPPKGSRTPGDEPINWLQRQLNAHVDGSDGGVGTKPLGELQIEGIYPLAYLREICGQPVEKVFATTTAHFHQANVDNNVDDLSAVTLHMANGVTGSLCIGRIGAASHADIGEIKLHVCGTNGAVVISEARPEISVYYKDQPIGEFRNRRFADENNLLLADHFANVLEFDEPSILDVRAGRDIAAIVDACLRSAESQQVEAVQ